MPAAVAPEGTAARLKANYWKESSADKALRMRINGENSAQMAWAETETAGGRDFSVDMKWDPDPALATADTYVMSTAAAYLIPKVLLLLLLAFFFMLPICFVCRLHGSVLPRPIKTVRRSGATYVFFSMVEMPFLGIAMAFACFSLLLDYSFFLLAGVPYWLARGAPSRAASMAVLKPFRGGPAVWAYPLDLLAVLVGQTLRVGLVEVAFCLAAMLVGLPTVKYHICTNPWVFELSERFVQQISTSMQDLGTPDELADTARQIISRCKQSRALQEHLDLWRFVPHYPYPPSHRRWAIGSQLFDSKLFLLTHVTHAIAEAHGSREHLLVSTSAACPVYRVMLWYNNPYHIFTGFVEASISNGAPSQLDKPKSGEHPMWLVTSRSPLLWDRKARVGVGAVDRFFDKWLPTYVHGCRMLVRGREIADAMRTEVISKDGISRPEHAFFDPFAAKAD